MSVNHDFAAALGLTVDGSETARDLFYALLVDRELPYPSEVMSALDDLGLTVIEAGA